MCKAGGKIAGRGRDWICPIHQSSGQYIEEMHVLQGPAESPSCRCEHVLICPSFPYSSTVAVLIHPLLHLPGRPGQQRAGGAVCGATDTEVQVTDYGNGTWAALYRSGGTVVPVNATGNLFGSNCSSFPGTLRLLASNPDLRGPLLYVPPSFQANLDNLGLGSLITAGALPPPLTTCVCGPASVTPPFFAPW